MTKLCSSRRAALTLLALASHAGCGDDHHTHAGVDGTLPADAAIARNDASSLDASSVVTARDAGPQVCGSATCTASEICVFPTCGCLLAGGGDADDAGACPDNYELTDAGECLPPSCTSDPPFCFDPSANMYSYVCSGVNGTIDGPTSDSIPDDVQRVCLQTCL